MTELLIAALIVVIVIQLCIAVAQNNRNRVLREIAERQSKELRRARVTVADYQDRLAQKHEWADIIGD